MSPSEGRPNSTVSARVIDALADAAGTDPMDVPPLYGTVDPDALDRLVASLGDTAGTSPATIEFTHADHRVTITLDGNVTITLDE